MSQYKTILTDLGKQKLNESLSKGIALNLTHMAIGDQTPDITKTHHTQLGHEVGRFPLNTLEKQATQLIATAIVPADHGGYTLKEAGLLDKEGHLIAIASLPATEKPTNADSVTHELNLNMLVSWESLDDVTIQTNTSLQFATQDWVQEKFMKASPIIKTHKIGGPPDYYASQTDQFCVYVLSNHPHQALHVVGGTLAKSFCWGYGFRSSFYCSSFTNSKGVQLNLGKYVQYGVLELTLVATCRKGPHPYMGETLQSNGMIQSVIDLQSADLLIEDHVPNKTTEFGRIGSFFTIGSLTKIPRGNGVDNDYHIPILKKDTLFSADLYLTVTGYLKGDAYQLLKNMALVPIEPNTPNIKNPKTLPPITKPHGTPVGQVLLDTLKQTQKQTLKGKDK